MTDPVESASKRSRTPLIVVALVLVLIASAVGAISVMRKQADAAYCKVYDESHAEMVDSLATLKTALAHQGSSFEAEGLRLELATKLLEKVKGVEQRRRDAAPSSLRPSWERVLSSSSVNTKSLSETKADDDAVAAINTYAHDICGLDGDM